MEFIDQQRAQGRRLEVVCRVLTEQGCRIAARTYRSWKHHQPSDREIGDQPILEKLQSLTVVEDGKKKPESLYGRRKMTRWLRRQGFDVSFRRVDRLMRQLGMNGIIRGRKIRTTIPDHSATRPPDLVDRVFTAEAPNLRWVADFTYVRTWMGWVYVAFITDCFSRRIVGWHAATRMTTALVETALRMAI